MLLISTLKPFHGSAQQADSSIIALLYLLSYRKRYRCEITTSHIRIPPQCNLRMRNNYSFQQLNQINSIVSVVL